MLDIDVRPALANLATLQREEMVRLRGERDRLRARCETAETANANLERSNLGFQARIAALEKQIAEAKPARRTWGIF